MQENTKRSIAINSLILYVRLAIVSVAGLLYTRFSLMALGEVDYGLFAVVGGIISFIALCNTIMSATSIRFIGVSIGKNDVVGANKIFNVNLAIHSLIALVTIVIAIPLGHVYINHFVSYQGDISNARMVFDITVVASALSFIGVPYNGLLMARERFLVFCSTDVLSSIFKLIGTYLLIDYFEHKLLVYAIIVAVMTAYPTLVFMVYCKRKFPEIVRFCFVREKQRYIEVLRFASGIAVGAVSCIAKSQGTALIVNAFFTTTMNTALAIANSVNNIVQLFANNIQKSVSPQIVKSYAAGNIERSTYLVCFSSKVTFLVMLCVSIPFLLVPETIFSLWLADVPEYAVLLTRLLIIDILILSVNAGVSEIVWATGRIMKYQILTNTISLCSVVVGFVVLKMGYPAEWLFYCYIVFSFILFIVRPYILLCTINFKVNMLYKLSYIPAFAVLVAFSPICLLKGYCNPWGYLFVAMVYYFAVTFWVGLTRKERGSVIDFIKRRSKKEKAGH